MSTLHLNRPSSTLFQAAVRVSGYRRWTMVGKPTKSKALAMMRMTKRFAAPSGIYDKGVVIMTADYYDPTHIVEIRRVYR